MLPYLGLALYLISSLFRPADWWEPVLDMPLDDYIFIVIFAGSLVSGSLPRVVEVMRTREAQIILLYFATQLASIVIAGTVGNLPTYSVLYFKMYCYYVAFAAFADTPKKIKGLLFLFIALATVVAVQSYEMLDSGVGLAGQGMYWGGRVRWIGMYDGANVLCMLFVIAMAFVLALVFGPWGIWTRILCLIGGALLVNGIYLTKSRGGFLALIVAVGLFLVIRGTALRKVRFRKFAIAVGGMVLLLMVAPARLETLNDEDHSSEGRINAWQEGIEMVRGSPLFGVGQGEWLNHHHRLAHNSAVQTMGETGTIGLFTWLLMLFIFLRALSSIVQDPQDPEEKSVATALLVALAAFLSISFFVTTTQFDLNYIFFGLISALVMRRNNPVVVTGSDLAQVAKLEIAIIVAIYLTVRIFYMVAT